MKPRRVMAAGILFVFLLVALFPYGVGHGADHGHVKMDSGLMATNESFTYVFDVEAVYDYGCTNHHDLTGVVFVASDAARSGAVELVILDGAYQERDGDGFKDATTIRVRPGTQVTWTVLDDTDETGLHSVSLHNFEETALETEESPTPVGSAVAVALLALVSVAWHRHRP